MITSKKGQMLKFLVGILLALIIFLPACKTASDIFQTSFQARNDFVEFKKTIKELQRSPLAEERKTALLIMDTRRAIVYYQKDAPDVLLEANFYHLFRDIPGNDDFHVLFEKPEDCEKGKSCLCLVDEYELYDPDADVEARTNDIDSVRIRPTKHICDSSLGLLEGVPADNKGGRNTCGFGKAVYPKLLYGYNCEGGFVIDRGIVTNAADEAIRKGDAFTYTLERRIPLQLIKKGDKIILQG